MTILNVEKYNVLKTGWYLNILIGSTDIKLNCKGEPY